MMASGGCTAYDGTHVLEEGNFVPGPDQCTVCKCINGEPSFCQSVMCMTPTDCGVFKKGDSCCHFICLDNPSSDVGLRMVGSAVTAILSLGLVVFLIHRLRQRKLRAAQHQYFSEHLESHPGESCHSNPCCHSATYFSSNDQINAFMNGATPPYSPWKASLYFQNKEPPPSYNEAVATDSPRSNRFQIANETIPPTTDESDLGVSVPVSFNQENFWWLPSLSRRLPQRDGHATTDRTPIPSGRHVNIPNRYSEEHESNLREACDARQQAIRTRQSEPNDQS